MARIATRRAVLRRLAVFLMALPITSCATPMSLHEAVARGNVSRIDTCMKRGMSVNAQDDQGNTPLHYAYYQGRQDIVDRLIAYGADPTIRNNDGDTPADVREIGRADNLLHAGTVLLDGNGDWTDAAKARPIYDELKGMDGHLVTKAIVRQVTSGQDRLRLLFLAVKLGIPRSEQHLNELLRAYGDKSMAEDYLNCGSQLLYEGAKRWAADRGYSINAGGGSHRVAWDQF
ncbi:MAG: ankyrin repeat domain-containing protein [Planctomycetes bacterium]|nr:ankyrin repeat domain-containing protein [Planctomycetota bacterium]